jgi:ribonuclease HI
LDSELVCKQLRGEYKVKNPELRRLYDMAIELKRCFKKASFVNVPRTNRFIKEADELVNYRLDEEVEKHN